MADICIGLSTVTLTPNSYVHGPEPPRPSCVESPATAGTSADENREHGHAAVLNDHEVAAASGVPSAAFALVETFAVYVAPASRMALGVRVAVRAVES
jgi:hypothetical protein